MPPPSSYGSLSEQELIGEGKGFVAHSSSAQWQRSAIQQQLSTPRPYYSTSISSFSEDLLTCLPVCPGVSSFEVDLENKKVVVTGDVTPYEVLVSVSKVMKFAELLV